MCFARVDRYQFKQLLLLEILTAKEASPIAPGIELTYDISPLRGAAREGLRLSRYRGIGRLPE